jgi:superfamily II DNA or RNA helicase/HKD family nuclease
MSDRTSGLYEVLITQILERELKQLTQTLRAQREPLRPADAGDRLALHFARIVRRVVEDLSDDDRVEVGVELVGKLINRLSETVGEATLLEQTPVGDVLQALLERRPDGNFEEIPAPSTPLLDTTLLTNAPGDPRVGHEILSEIYSADRIDAVIAFIRRSGIAPMVDALRRHCERGRELRVLTTTYTGSTEARAIESLLSLGARVRVSYDTSLTRLHAKAWLFHRRSGFSTAYIGSSNLTHAAQIAGLEWNVRVSSARNPDVVEKVAAVFESYWNNGDFRDYIAEEFAAALNSVTQPEQIYLSPVEIRPEPFQARLLEQIALSRQNGHHRNLLVSATGTGKTVMAALDYARLRSSLNRARLLFVAHREEILSQSLATFRHGLRAHDFGERWVGGSRPSKFDHVFASIQSLNASGVETIAPDHFDVVIVDEFHHAAAPSYAALLDHLKPAELLGLTATPERSDGMPILQWFDNRIAAELRLWDAIDQHRLSPFVYYGVHDGIDLTQVPWRRGRGYDVDGLSRVLTAHDAIARMVIAQVESRVDELRNIRALGFCVSVDHARFMSRVFTESGIPSTAVWADSSDVERASALRDLATGKINVLFSVDLFNEGVDIPTVDTLLMLRPTDSPTLFLQQLGRGLRLSPGKSVCTVLDFVGLHRKEFRFDRRFRALFGGSRKDLERHITDGFPFLPAGCHMELDAVASKIVLENIRTAIPSTFRQRAEELRQIAQGNHAITLDEFLEESGLELEDVYATGKTWSDLREAAGLSVAPKGPVEEKLREACSRLLHIDDEERIKTYQQFLSSETPPHLGGVGEPQRRLLRMLILSLTSGLRELPGSLASAAALIWQHRQVRAEVHALLRVLSSRIDHVQPPLDNKDVPLRMHARYTRREILAAFGIGDGVKVRSWREGVLWAKEAKADLLAFTLDKTTGGFSPTTRYRDFAISRDLIHWESQSTTPEASETGHRYQHHVARGTSIMLFARENTDAKAFWFLGPATYVRHEGELPMAVTWRLQHQLPGDLFTRFAAAVA